MIEREMSIAVVVFVLAGISDGVDGYLARRFNARTQLGAYLDPLADKALLVAVYVTLGALDDLPAWLVILVVFRDILIIGGSLLAKVLDNPMRLEPLVISKINTFSQLVLAAVALGELGMALDIGATKDALVWVVALTTTASGVGYLVRGARGVRDVERRAEDMK